MSNSEPKYLKYKIKYLNLKNKQIGGGNMFPPTLNGIERWTKSLYEKLGWMILSQNRGKQLKVNAYIGSIDNLIQTINKRSLVVSSNKKKYMEILHDKATQLKTMVDRILKINLSIDQTNETKPSPITLKGVEEWLKYLYEKLGWMALTKDNNDDYKDKIAVYKNSIQSLINSINVKITQVNSSEIDMIYDLYIVLIKAKKLNEYATKLL
jgi:hypothetical protein